MTTSFWDSLTDDDRRALSGAGTVRTYPVGVALCRQGQAGVDVFVLRDGSVEVFQDDVAGNRTVLARRGVGDLLCEMSALDGAPVSATITALAPVRALTVPAVRFGQLCRARPGLGLTVITNVAARLRDSDASRVQSRTDVLHRTARILVRLAESGQPSTTGVVVLRLTQQELADMVPAALASVTRALDELRRVGAVSTGRGHIRMENLDLLRSLVLSAP